MKSFLNLEGHQNCISGSKVMVILLNGLILRIGGVASGMVCACSLRNRLFFKYKVQIYSNQTIQEQFQGPLMAN
jgi:hypothetical protein